ncbi:MAG TPA: hypothetical protein DEA78_12675, partial [Cyanobacteria bacterium UBA11159]|nr:hypothetical protein [Cyanobacteria bacterium UBA11159]
YHEKSQGKKPNSELRTPNSELRTPNSELRTPVIIRSKQPYSGGGGIKLKNPNRRKPRQDKLSGFSDAPWRT